MMAVCGIGNPKGLRNSANTAYQSARPPMVAASANAATKPKIGCTCNNAFAVTNSASVPASTSVASALPRRSAAARAASPGASNENVAVEVMAAFRRLVWGIDSVTFHRRHSGACEARTRNLEIPDRRFASSGMTAEVTLRADAPIDVRVRKKARLSGPSKEQLVSRSRSGGLGVDLGEVVLRGLGTVGDELAEIFGRGLRPRHEHFAARPQHVGLDLHRLIERLGGSQPVDAGEERLGVLIERGLDIAADLGGPGDRTGNGGFDRGGHLLRTGMKVGSANLRGLGLLLHELTGSFGNFHVLELGERLGDGRESFLDAVHHGIGLGGHVGLSILRFELWAHPVRCGPGRDRCAIVNGATQHQWCGAISRIRDNSNTYSAR